MSRRLTVLVVLALAPSMATRVHAQIPVIDVAHLTQAVLIAQRAQRHWTSCARQDDRPHVPRAGRDGHYRVRRRRRPP